MSETSAGVRAAGAWLFAASILLVIALAFHGPIAPDVAEQMARIAGSPQRWSVVHWIATASLSSFAVSGLLVLVSRSRLTRSPRTMSAWAVVTVGALWTLTTAVTEVTVVADLAVSGDRALFEAWWSFAEGHANGFAFLAVAVAVIAACEAGSVSPLTARWAAHFGSAAGLTSFAGWSLGVWFEVGPANLLWVAASMLMCVWTGWLGIAMARAVPGTLA